MQQVHSQPTRPLRGVNLGGWLVLEKWMTPSLFDGLSATRRNNLVCRTRRRCRRAIACTLEYVRHARRFRVARARSASTPCAFRSVTGSSARRTRITRSTVRIRFRIVVGGIDVLDRAIDWAAECGLARRCSTCTRRPVARTASTTAAFRTCASGTRAPTISRTRVDVLERLAARYRGHRALHAIQLLNEPRWDIADGFPDELTTARAYHAIRAHCSAERRRDRASRRFPFAPRIHGFLAAACVRERAVRRASLSVLRPRGPRARLRPVTCKRQSACGATRPMTCNASLHCPAIVGEWSLGLDIEVVSLGAKMPVGTLRLLDTFRRDVGTACVRCRAALAFERLSRLVLLELSNGNNAGVVLPRVRRTRLAARTLSVKARCAHPAPPAGISSPVLGVSTILRSCSASSPGWKTDRQQRRIGQLALQHLEHRAFAVGVERVGRFLHENPLRPQHQRAREADSCCCVFAAQDLLPVRVLVEARRKPPGTGAVRASA